MLFINLCKRFVPRSGPTERWAGSGSRLLQFAGLIHLLLVFQCFIMHKVQMHAGAIKSYCMITINALVQEDNPRALAIDEGVNGVY